MPIRTHHPPTWWPITVILNSIIYSNVYASVPPQVRGQYWLEQRYSEGAMKVALRRARGFGTHFPYITTFQQQRAGRKSTARFQDDWHERRSTASYRCNAGMIAECYRCHLHPCTQKGVVPYTGSSFTTVYTKMYENLRET